MGVSFEHSYHSNVTCATGNLSEFPIPLFGPNVGHLIKVSITLVRFLLCLIAALILSLRCVNAVKSDTGRVHHTISLTVPQATFVAHKIDDDLQLQEGWPPVVKHERLLWKFEYDP